MSPARIPLGELLVSAGRITEATLAEVLEKQRHDGRRLGKLLVELGHISEAEVIQVLSQQLSIPWVSLYHVNFTHELLALVPRSFAERLVLIPIFLRRVRGVGQELYVAMDDPTDNAALNELGAWLGLSVRAMVAPPSEILAAISYYYDVPGDQALRPLAEALAETGPLSRRARSRELPPLRAQKS